MKRSTRQPDAFFFAIQSFRSHLQGSGPRMGQELQGLVGEVPQDARITQAVYLPESFEKLRVLGLEPSLGILAFYGPPGGCDGQLG